MSTITYNNFGGWASELETYVFRPSTVVNHIKPGLIKNIPGRALACQMIPLFPCS